MYVTKDVSIREYGICRTDKPIILSVLYMSYPFYRKVEPLLEICKIGIIEKEQMLPHQT